MKAISKILIGLLFFTGSLSQAQVSVNVNIGSPPAWGPVGYTGARYYYLPDIETYYDLGTRQYVYVQGGKWVRAGVLPVAYRNYDLYRGYKVVVTNYRGGYPYYYYTTHKAKYPKGYRGKPQKTIGLPPGQAKKMAVVHSPGHSLVLVKPKGPGKHHGKGHGGGHGHGRH
jgi:hypothetical protein